MTPGSTPSRWVASAEVSIRSRLVKSIRKGWDWRDRYEGDEDEGGIDPGGRVRRGAVPMGRDGRGEEVSAMVSYLASDLVGYVTGQNFRIDGGLTRGF